MHRNFGFPDLDHQTDVNGDVSDEDNGYVVGVPMAAIAGVALALVALLALVMMISIIASAPQAHAHDAAAMVDPHRAQWFESLKQPGNGIGCCNLTDCRQTQARQLPDQTWEAILTDYRGQRWVKIPPEKVLTKQKSIDGEAYICNTAGGPASPQYDTGSGRTYTSPAWEGGVLCFIPPVPGF